MAELPIENAGQARVFDHVVAGAEIAMHQCGRARRRPVGEEPDQHVFERRARDARLVERVAHFRNRRAYGIGLRQRKKCEIITRRADCMDPRELPAELAREIGPMPREVRIAHDAATLCRCPE